MTRSIPTAFLAVLLLAALAACGGSGGGSPPVIEPPPTDPPPELTAVNPGQGPTGGGTDVTLTGDTPEAKPMAVAATISL